MSHCFKLYTMWSIYWSSSITWLHFVSEMERLRKRKIKKTQFGQCKMEFSQLSAHSELCVSALHFPSSQNYVTTRESDLITDDYYYANYGLIIISITIPITHIVARLTQCVVSHKFAKLKIRPNRSALNYSIANDINKI